jgi:hypothetical protein
MIKKLILSLIILFVWYILLIFTMPSVASAIEQLLWIGWFNQKVIDIRDSFNNKTTTIPSKDELLSWALDLKNNIIDWVDTTKEKIDSFRETMSGVEDTYNDLKDWYNEVKDFIDTNSWKIEDAKEILNTVSDITQSLTNTWETN